MTRRMDAADLALLEIDADRYSPPIRDMILSLVAELRRARRELASAKGRLVALQIEDE